MKIEEIDSNFLVNTGITESDIIWLDIRQAPFVLLGINYDERYGCYTRMPQDIAAQVSEGVADINHHTAGGRVRFRTNSEFIGIHAVMNNNAPVSHMTLVCRSGFDLYRKKGVNFQKNFITHLFHQWGCIQVIQLFWARMAHWQTIPLIFLFMMGLRSYI